MAAVVSKKLYEPVQPGTSVGTRYTVGPNIRTTIDKLTYSNVTGTARTVTVYLVPSGGTAGVTNMIRPPLTIPANDVREVYEAEGHVLNAGDSIQDLCDGASAVNSMGSGREIAL